jgi:hypothetical protein
MRTMHPRATCHSVAFSCTTSVITIDAAASNDAAAVTAKSADAFSAAYRTECCHKNAGLAIQDARTDTNVERTGARQTAAATRSNVCRANERRLPLQYCCYEIPARHVLRSCTVLRSVRCRRTRQVTIAPPVAAPASRTSFSRNNQSDRQPANVTFSVFSPARTDYKQRRYRQRSQPKFLPLFFGKEFKSPGHDGIRVDRYRTLGSANVDPS